MTTNLFAFDIPEGMLWGDCFYEESISIIEETASVTSVATSGGWEEVGKIAPKVEQAYARPPKWCKHGNACLWQNCPFRHERCAIYDKWIANNKRGYSCRCMAADPESCKSPEEGGCKYDHRDPSKLETYYKTLPCKTEAEMWDSFCDRGLESCYADTVDTSKMSRTNKSLLIRSLTAENIEYDDCDTWMKICFYDS
jgi:hypothetical protein